MILSVHLAKVPRYAVPGAMPGAPARTGVDGLRYAVIARTVQLGGGVLPKLEPSGVGLVAAWDNDDSLDRFLQGHPLAERLSSGWHVRLQPVKVAWGSWAGLAGLADEGSEAAADEPVAALTFGRLRLTQAVRFLRASSQAEQLAVSHPGLLASRGLARPPHLVFTFSLWRDSEAMRDYALGGSGEGHIAAVRAHHQKPFHTESIFAHFRPYRSAGLWSGSEMELNGRDPLVEARAGG